MKRNLLFVVGVAVFLVGLALVTSGKLRADNQDKDKKGSVNTVAEFQFIGQNGPLSPVTLLVPREDGLYRVSAYANVVTPSNFQDYECGRLVWTDNVNTYSNIFPNTNNQAVGAGQFVLDLSGTSLFASGSFFIRAKASQPVTFEMDNCHGTTNGQYNLYLTVEHVSRTE